MKIWFILNWRCQAVKPVSAFQRSCFAFHGSGKFWIQFLKTRIHRLLLPTYLGLCLQCLKWLFSVVMEEWARQDRDEPLAIEMSMSMAGGISDSEQRCHSGWSEAYVPRASKFLPVLIETLNLLELFHDPHGPWIQCFSGSQVHHSKNWGKEAAQPVASSK